MTTKTRIGKRNGRWFTRASDGVQFHPTWHLAMLYAKHMDLEDKFLRPMGEHLTTRMSDLKAWGHAPANIAMESGVPLATVRDLMAGNTCRVTPQESEALTTIYRKACAA